jgi:hypothetical protein
MPTWMLRLAIAALTLGGFGCNREPADSAATQRAIRDVDAKVRRYDPAAAADSTRRHYAVAFRITNGVLTPEDSPAEIRPGNPPYHPPIAAGGMLVVYRDATGTELGRYTIEDPGSARSCDQADGKRGESRPIDSGRVAIALPPLPSIAQLDLGPSPDKLRRFDVSASIQKAAPPAARGAD